jgi:hypothetical protein
MMKLIKLITATILASSAIAITPTQAWPQAGVGYVPGYWQPEVKAENPREPIVLKLVNESGLPVTYNLDPGPERFLPAGSATTLIVDLNNQADNYATVNIYNSDILGYEYNAEGNVITVRITRGYPDKDHKAVYITETGRVYSF